MHLIGNRGSSLLLTYYRNERYYSLLEFLIPVEPFPDILDY